MEALRDRFNSIKSLGDLQPYLIDTEDGESPTLEFKSLQGYSFDKNNVGDTMANLAKEICAFLNTGGGLILWGGSYNKTTSQATISNASTENLSDFLDKRLSIMVEPAPKGVDYDWIKDNDDNRALLIFVPRSDFAPHRVGSWTIKEGEKAKEKITGRYFQRVGTSSQMMSENLIRAMYLSSGHIPTISIHTELEIPTSHSDVIYLKTIVNPDSYKFISQYHNSNQIAIMTSMSKVKLNGFDELNRFNAWHEIHCPDPSVSRKSIYPKDTEYTLLTSSILPNGDTDFDRDQEIIDGNVHLTPQLFSRIFAIATKSTFACDAVPLAIKNRLYILGNSRYWQYEDYTTTRMAVLMGIEEEFNTEIYVARPYQDDLLDDRDGVVAMEDDGRLRVSEIVATLKSLQEFTRTE